MLDVIALGEVLIDFTPAGCSEEGKPLYEQNPGGAPANVLCGLAKLGSKTAFIGKAGDDPLGTFLQAELERAGVSAAGLALTDEAHTTMAFVHLQQDGEREFRFVRGADILLSAEEVSDALAEGCRIFHFGSLSMTDEASAAVTLEAALRAKGTGALVSYDPNLRLSLWDDPQKARQVVHQGLQAADIAKLSEEELFFLTGETNPESGASRLMERHPAMGLLLVTLGERGCFIRGRKEWVGVPGFSVSVRDTTGAGDAFMAGFLYQLLSKNRALEQLSAADYAEMGRFANAMGALAATRRGAIPALPSMADIRNLLDGAEDSAMREKYRPQYHFTPPSQWLNDPNGMVYFEGEYHLFYQYHPYSNVWGPMHWGHAISTDLVRWEHLPVALAPDANGMIFSGCAVADVRDASGFFAGGAGLVAVFTQADEGPGSQAGDSEEPGPRQRQSLAYSRDKGRTWTMYAGNPVLTDEGMTDFRDPKVFWYEPDSRWVMVLAAGDHIRFYTSPDLKNWSFASEFGRAEGSHDGVWECPDLFELPVDGEDGWRKWVLLVSIGDRDGLPEGSRTQYFVGRFDGKSFANDADADRVLWLDEGRDNYAGVTWSDIPESDGRRILIGWMNNWKYANETPTESWRGAMTLPRELSLRSMTAGIRLCQQPVRELSALRGPGTGWSGFVLDSGVWAADGLKGGVFEIEAEFELAGAAEFGFRLRQSDAEETLVGYDTEQAMLFVDRTRSGESAFCKEFAVRHGAVMQPREGTIRIRLFADWSSVEAFGNDGTAVLTDQIFPGPDSLGIALYAKEGAVKVRFMNFYRLSDSGG